MPPVEQSTATDALPEELTARLKVAVPGYRLLRVLGRGGQANVYQAVDAATGQLVAIKVLHDGPFASEAARARLKKEIIALKALDHPGIVRILGEGQTTSGHDFLIMNFIDGRSLDEHAFSSFPAASIASQNAMLTLFARVCAIVGFAHRSGVTHRDLSPSNIRIDSVGNPHILDFGLARTAFDSVLIPGAAATNTGQFLGKLAYASPEQVAGDPSKIDIRTDVYSLGVLLHQILTGGQFPYDISGSPAEILHNICHAPPRPIAHAFTVHQSAATPVHADLEAIVSTALEKDPNRRFQSASEMAQALEKYLAGQSVSFPFPSRHRLRNWIAALLLLAGISPLTFLLLHRQAPSSMQPNASIKGAPSPDTFLVPLKGSKRQFITNSLGMKFLRIEPGTFMMGTPLSEPDRSKYNEPVPRQVTITSPFLMQVTHVTRGQFASFVQATGYKTDDERLGGVSYPGSRGTPDLRDPSQSWRDPGFSQEDDHPVVAVSWNDAIAFAAWLSEKEGKNYSLPTEAQWEFAARAGTHTAYFWGASPQWGKGYGNTAAPVWDDGYQYTSPVGAFKPNAWGLYDMCGNAWEWCSDFFTSAGSSESVDPQGPLPDPVGINFHPLRGAGFGTQFTAFRVGFRYGGPADSASNSTGFRLVMDSRPFLAPHQQPVTASAPVNALPARSPARINLLAIVDPDRDNRHGGGWTLANGILTSTGPTQQLEFPYVAPAEYDFHLGFTPPDIDLSNLQFFFPAGGKENDWHLGERGNSGSWFEMASDQRRLEDNPTVVRKAAFMKPGEHNLILLKVRKDGVQAFVNNALIHDYRTDYHEFHVPDWLTFQRGDTVGVMFAMPGVHVDQAEITEVSGIGKLLREPHPGEAAILPLPADLPAQH